MRTKFHVSYVDKNKRPRKTIIFGENREEAESVFAENYKGCMAMSVEKECDAETLKKSSDPPKEADDCYLEKGISVITSEKSCMLPFAGEPESLFDWYAEQRKIPKWKFHVLFLTEEISDKSAMIITNHFIEAPERGLTMDFIRKMFVDDIRKGKINETQALHVCCVKR
jgi:hypothetical protein